MAEESDLSIETYNPTFKYTIKWLVKNVLSLPPSFKERSSNFSVSPQSEWYIEFEKDECDYHSLYIRRKANSIVTVIFKISVSDGKGGNLYNSSKFLTSESGEMIEDLLPDPDNYASYKDKIVNVENLLFTVLIEAKHPHITVETKSNSKLKVKEDVTMAVQNEDLRIRKEALSSTSYFPSNMILLETNGNEHIEDVNT